MLDEQIDSIIEHCRGQFVTELPNLHPEFGYFLPGRMGAICTYFRDPGLRAKH